MLCTLMPVADNPKELYTLSAAWLPYNLSNNYENRHTAGVSLVT